MTALTRDRMTPERPGNIVPGMDVKADTKIFIGSIVVNDAGDAAPGRTATGLYAVGVAEETVDNSGGSAGDKKINVRKGVFRFANDGTDTVTDSHIGQTCYIVDDQTVASNDGTGTRSAAGKVFKVDSTGVWVTFD